MDRCKRSCSPLLFGWMVMAVALLNFFPSNAFCSDSKALINNETKSKKLSFLVGINDYPYVAKLRGAVNDVENMKQLLVERFGFPDDNEHMLVLTDKQATRDAILHGLREHLIAKATPDSIVVFHFSGHGSKIGDMSKRAHQLRAWVDEALAGLEPVLEEYEAKKAEFDRRLADLDASLV